jgi:dTDP-4-amino-4,6-dideoxygalactose transaminase
MVGRELEYITEAVTRGQLAGDGSFTKRCQQWLERQCNAHRVLLTHSCTAALEMAMLLCELAEGDEVVMPSFTFVSTANAVVLRGARPVFVDIRADTLNLDERLVPGALSTRTRVIMPVHYAGVACDMAPLLELARERGLRVVEDAAQGLGATYRGRDLGTLGDMGCWSFHETKNFISGEGGALVIQDPLLVARAEILWQKGTNRSQFERREVAKYSWVDVGSSFLPSELTAAFLLAQFERWQEILERRRQIVSDYCAAFQHLADRGRVRLPVIPPHCEPNGHLFYLLLEDEKERDELLAHLVQRGINAVFHYVPLHESAMGSRLGYAKGDFPITESISRRLIRLPCFFSLTGEQQTRVVAAVHGFFSG